MQYVGIDWADAGYQIVIVNNEVEDVGTFKVEKSANGFNKFLEKLRAREAEREELLMGIETKNDAIVDFLLSQGYRLYLIHPNKMKGFRSRYTSGKKKDDVFDAYVIANVVRTDRKVLELINPKADSIKRIGFLYRQRHKAKKDETRLKNRLTITLKEYYPAFLNFFSDISCPTALALLEEYPTFKQISELSLEEITEFLRSQSYYSSDGAEKIYKAIQEKQIAISSAIIESRRILAVNLARRLRYLLEEINGYEKCLDKEFETEDDSEIFMSLPGSKTTTSAGFMTIFGKDRERYHHTCELNALTGISPITITSGNYKSIQFRTGCNSLFRHIVTQFAYTSKNNSIWAKSYYNKKIKEGKTHRHALRCLAERWMKIIFAMWKNGEKYDEDKILAARERHRMKKNAA